MGARFEYEGEEYVKTGPMFATGKGGQRMIPKYALLKPLDAVPASGKATKKDTLSRRDLMPLLDAFANECRGLLPDDRRGDLDAAYGRLLERIDRLTA